MKSSPRDASNPNRSKGATGEEDSVVVQALGAFFLFIMLMLVVCACFRKEKRQLDKQQDTRHDFVDKHVIIKSWKKAGPKEKNTGTQKEPCPDSLASMHSQADAMCPICLNEFQDGEKVVASNNPACNHIFHHTCIMAWLYTKETCPQCREVYVVETV